ncbi:MAG: gliding motility-associated C-terminal domain-containing protein [Pedobacter sp.]|nr:MAG: gliding motility-associated C-terminal domain-containing protein [Pedobacter sp.]
MQIKGLIIRVFLTLLIGTVVPIKAADFIVTTNQDSGPGSLRAAIAAAAANGIGTQDRILFSISPASQASDLTISISAALQNLSSNLLIDGSTQPGNFFNNTNIKVRLRRSNDNLINGLIVDNANNIEIRGLYFSDFQTVDDPLTSQLRGAIYLRQSTNITIANNAFTNNYAGIFAPLEPGLALVGVKIESNYFGLLPDGVAQNPNKNGIDVSSLRNSTIGGSTPALGNYYAAAENSHINTAGMTGTMLIANNTIGFDIAGRFIPSPRSIGIYANGLGCTLTVESNIIGGQRKGIVISEVNQGFLVRKNKIGTDASGTGNFGNAEVGIEIFNCARGTIGSTNATEKNDIAYNQDGILIVRSERITITRNSMFCNRRYPIYHQNVDIDKFKAPILTSISGTVRGTYLPNGIIEVFGDDECDGCQGKTYLGFARADGIGAWTYTGSLSGAITVTGTNEGGGTSSFTSPILEDQARQIVDEQCGNANGSIRNVNVAGATTFTWYRSDRTVAARTKDLVNVKAGIYYLVAGQDGGCQVTSPNYEIKNIEVSYKVQDASLLGAACGKTNGSVIISSFQGEVPKGFEWRDENNRVVSNERNLTNAAAGTYSLFGDNGLGCRMLIETFTIAPVIDFIINDNSKRIVNTDCTKDEGSILGIAFVGGTAPFSYEWRSEVGDLVASTRDLLNVPSGAYHLKITDSKGCTVQSDVFKIPPSPLNAKIANTFSPNGDGINDVWRIPGLEGLLEFELKIFNRQGNIVFHAKNEAKDFDGRFNNVDLPVGVYYYTIDLKNSNCKGGNGRIMLIR